MSSVASSRMPSVMPLSLNRFVFKSPASASSLTPTRTVPSAPPSMGVLTSRMRPRSVRISMTSGSSPAAGCSSRRWSGIPFENVCAMTRPCSSRRKMYATKSLLRFVVWMSSSRAKRLPVWIASLLSSATSTATLVPRRSSDARMTSEIVDQKSSPVRRAKRSTIAIMTAVSFPAMRSFANQRIRSPLPVKTAGKARAAAERTGR